MDVLLLDIKFDNKYLKKTMAIASTYFTENCAQLGQYIKSLDNQIAELEQKKIIALRAFSASKGAEAVSVSLNLEVNDV